LARLWGTGSPISHSAPSNCRMSEQRAVAVESAVVKRGGGGGDRAVHAHRTAVQREYAGEGVGAVQIEKTVAHLYHRTGAEGEGPGVEIDVAIDHEDGAGTVGPGLIGANSDRRIEGVLGVEDRVGQTVS
jgi:hypothetical protein